MDALRSNVSKSIVTWWYDRTRRLGRAPMRADFDPAEFVRILPYVYLVDVEPEGRYRIRLSGTYIVDLWGFDSTGMAVDAGTFGEKWMAIGDIYDDVVRRCVPIGTHERVEIARGLRIDVEVTHLPLVDGEGRVNMILGTLVRMGPLPRYDAATLDRTAFKWEIVARDLVG